MRDTFVACSCWFLYDCLLWVICSALSGHLSITNRNISNCHILYSLCMHHWVVRERERRGTPLISRFVYRLLSFVTSVDFFVWVQYCCVVPSLLQHLSPPSYNTCPLPLTTLVPSLLQHSSPPSYNTCPLPLTTLVPSHLQHSSPPSYNTCPLPLTTLVPSLLQHSDYIVHF